MELAHYLDRGGIIVYILIAMNVIGITIMLWKGLVLFSSNRKLQTITDELIEELSLSANDYQLAQIQAAVSLKIKQLELGLNTVKIIATTAPLLGLLGTVLGILHSFDSITHMGLGDPTVFSGGISIALITTVAGLIVAIPHYVGYNYFVGSLDSLEIKLEKNILKTIKR